MILLALWLLAARPSSLTVVVSVPLSAELDGMDGKIELLVDGRLRPGICASIAKSPLLPATVRLLDASGKVLDERRFKRELETAELRDSRRRTFLVTVDWSIGAGSYAGPTTYFVEPSDRRLVWAKARDRDSGSVSEMQVSRTLKSAWKLSPRADGHGQDLLAVHCAPDFDAERSGGRLSDTAGRGGILGVRRAVPQRGRVPVSGPVGR